MRNHKRYFDAAYAVALSSPGAGGKRSRFRLGAVLVHKKQILTAKYNSMKTHPLMGFFYDYPHLHAEAACIFNLGLDNCADADLYVMRIDRKNRPALARPCINCQKLIKHVGIKRIFYSTDIGFERLR